MLGAKPTRFQAQMYYHFGVRSFVRTIVQYVDVSRNPAAYTFPVESHDRNLFTQFLFSYKLNPQTVAFVGYSDARDGTSGYGLTRPRAHPAVGAEQPPPCPAPGAGRQ